MISIEFRRVEESTKSNFPQMFVSFSGDWQKNIFRETFGPKNASNIVNQRCFETPKILLGIAAIFVITWLPYHTNNIGKGVIRPNGYKDSSTKARDRGCLKIHTRVKCCPSTWGSPLLARPIMGNPNPQNTCARDRRNKFIL